MSKSVLKAAFVYAVIVAVVVFLVWSFVYGTLNTSEWGFEARLWAAHVWAALSILGVAPVAIYSEDMRGEK